MPAVDPSPAPTPTEVTRVLRVIARMNIGGPAHHVSMLSGRLDRRRFATRLAYGRIAASEGSFEQLAEREGCVAELVPGLGPEIRPLDDLRALFALIGILHRYRPHILHTHTAKAGFLARLAAVLSPHPRPIIVHTYHGHVLEGYFGRRTSAIYRFLERRLASVSDCLIGVSKATVDDLVRLGVAGRDRFRVVPIGLDLERFRDLDAKPAVALERGVGEEEVVAAYVGRLVPIKRVDLILRAVAEARRQGSPIRLVVGGDGECRQELERLADDLGLADSAEFLGYVSDASTLVARADLAILASDNEGTPVALIEAAAAGRPAVATAVGGVPEVVVPGAGILVPRGDYAALAAALDRCARDRPLREQMGAHAREHVLRHFSVHRLLNDIENLYNELLARPRAGSTRAQASSPHPDWRPCF